MDKNVNPLADLPLTAIEAKLQFLMGAFNFRNHLYWPPTFRRPAKRQAH